MAPKKNATSSATTGGKTAAPQSSASSAHPDAATRPVAVIITDSFTEELKPLTNVRPRALMPIGNVPLIEYALELLVVNGIKEVKIVTYFGADKIQEHLATTVTYTGKTWLNSNEIKVEVVKGSSGTQSLGRALVDVLHLHQLPEHFILLPVDIITTARNLSNIFATHVRRHRANPTMVLTAAVLEAATPLMDAHRISVRRALETTEKKLSSPLTAMSNTSSIEFPAFQLMMAEASAATLATAKTTTDQEHCTIAYEPQNGYIITGYQSWSQNERAVQMELTQLQPLEQTKVMNAAVSLTLNAKSDTVVRSDLINPGILVISQGFVSEVLQEQAMISDSNDFLRYFVDNPGFCQILAAVDFLSDEQKGHFTPLDDIMSNNAVGASVRPTFTGGNNPRISPVPELFPTPVTTSAPLFRSSSALSDPTTVPSFRVFARGGAVPTQPCVVFPVRTMDSYISTNIAVCERRVFPFTRESNFAEKNPTYAVWHHMPNVYVHANQPDRLSARMALGPNAIVGNSCHLGRSASVAGSVLGDRVTIGEGAVVLHSVVMADTVIADGVVVHNSIIGSNVQILAKEMRIESCAVGDNVVVSKDMQSKAWPQGSRVTIAANGVSDASIVGANGSGALYTAHLRGKTSVDAPLQLANLFVRDPPIKKADESDDDSPLSPLEALYEIIYREMDAAVVSSSSLDTFAFTWKQSMLSYGLNMEDLLECITRAIVTYVAAREAQADDQKAAQKAVCAVLKRFCRPVYGSLIKRKGPDRTQHMFAILRGLAVALYTSTAVQERAKFILFYLYAKADEELFEERQWCMVNLKSIIAFDDMARNNVEEVAGVHDEAIVSCGWEWLHDYVDELRADDDEEDGAAAA